MGRLTIGLIVKMILSGIIAPVHFILWNLKEHLTGVQYGLISFREAYEDNLREMGGMK